MNIAILIICGVLIATFTWATGSLIALVVCACNDVLTEYPFFYTIGWPISVPYLIVKKICEIVVSIYQSPFGVLVRKHIILFFNPLENDKETNI